MNYKMKAKCMFANLFPKNELTCDKEYYVSFKCIQFSKEDFV